MSASTYEDLQRHVGHSTAVVTYGSPPVNVAIECEDCNEVLLDFDHDGEPQWDVAVRFRVGGDNAQLAREHVEMLLHNADFDHIARIEAHPTGFHRAVALAATGVKDGGRYLVAWTGGLESPQYFTTNDLQEAQTKLAEWSADATPEDYIDLLDLTGDEVKILQSHV